MMMMVITILTLLGTSMAAPTDGPIRIPLAIPEAPPGFLAGVNDQVSALGETAYKNAAAINGLLQENLVTAADSFNNGYSAVTAAVRGGIQSAGSAVSHKLATTGRLVNQASTLVHNTAATGGQALADGAEVVANTKASVAKSVTASVGAILPNTGVFAEQPRKVSTAILETEDLPSRALSVKENIQKMFAGIFQPKPIVDTIREEEKYGNNGDKFEPVGRALVTGTENLLGFLSNAVNIPFDFAKSVTRSASSSLNNLGSRLIGL